MDLHDASAQLDELKSRVALAETVNQISTSLASCLDLPKLVGEVIASVKGLLEAEAATVFLYDQASGELTFDAVSGGAEEEVRSLRLKPGEGLAGWVAEHQAAVAVADVQHDPRFSGRLDEKTGFVTRSVVAAPLMFRGRLVGVVEAVNRTQGRSFSDADARTLATLAPHVAVALNNAGITAELVSSKEGLEAEVQRRLVQIINGKKEWERTFDAIEDPLLIIEAGYRVRRANLAVAARSGLPIVQVPGKRCYEVAFGRDAPCPGCPLAEALAGKAASAVLELDGAVFQASHFPIDNGAGEVYAAACTYRDVTAAREMEARLREVEKMASVGQLAAGVAHEINNPMAFLSSNLSTLRSYFDDLGSVVRKVRLLAPVADRAADDQLREVVRRLARAVGTELDLDDILTDGVALLDESEGGAKRVTHIVRQLQAFAKEKRSAEEDVRLADSVERAVRTLAAEVPGAEVQVARHTDARVRVSPISLDQALTALLRNAVQAAPGAPVDVTVDLEDDLVVLAVEDRGEGIPQEVRGRIFDPFFTTRGIGGGLGLGLATVYATVRRHRGVVEVEDRPGGGTRMVLKFPVVPALRSSATAVAVSRAHG